MWTIVYLLTLLTICLRDNNFPITLAQFNFVPRVVGGKSTTIDFHPYQLSLRKFNAHFCGAVLIGPKIVATAAHCLENSRPEDVTIRGGSSYHTKGGKILQATKICSHPNYSPTSSDYDVAVLQLNQTFAFFPNVRVVPLQGGGREVAAGSVGIVTGWGQLHFNGPLPDNLHMVRLPRILNDECARCYPEENVTERMACYGYKDGGKDVCYGDSGGPVIVDGRLTGISSWGYGCGFPGRPNVFTKISNPEINNFITQFLDNPSLFDQC